MIYPHRLHSSKLEYIVTRCGLPKVLKEAARFKHVNIAFRDDGIPPAVPSRTFRSRYSGYYKNLAERDKHRETTLPSTLRGLSGELQLSFRMEAGF